jgi:hypothetical protein
MSKKPISIGPHGDGRWQVKKHGADRASSVHETKEEADRVGRDQARREGVELFIHGRDGKIQDRDSFGNDPCPPKDTKH